MKILQIHNFYQQAGGEDRAYAAECQLLARNGHSVEQYSLHNDAVGIMPGIDVALRTIWNRESYRAVRKIIGHFRPDLIHAHNTFPLVSPSIYYAAAAEQTPVVQTLHNYRLICPAATLYREGRVCEDCVRLPVPYSGVLHACYRRSRLASGVVAALLTGHRLAGTWNDKVQTYIALTEFSRGKFIEGGLPAHKIAVKPNFLPEDPGAGPGDGGFALFAGRLSEEKGLDTLLDAWQQLPDIPLKIAGDGPLRRYVSERARTLPQVDDLGFCDQAKIRLLMRSAAFLVFPSNWYEGMPMTIIEAMACGTPVVASDLGSLQELVREEEDGLRFAAGNPDELAGAVRRLLQGSGTLPRLRTGARRRFELQYGPERNYRLLCEIYNATITGRSFGSDYA